MTRDRKALRARSPIYLVIAGALVIASCGGRTSQRALGTDCESETVILAAASASSLNAASEGAECSERIEFRGAVYDTTCFIVHSRHLGRVLIDALDVAHENFVYSGAQKLKGVPADRAIVLLTEPDLCPQPRQHWFGVSETATHEEIAELERRLRRAPGVAE